MVQEEEIGLETNKEIIITYFDEVISSIIFWDLMET